eukprot:7938924-Karenia_brevis.AAC.1
MGLYELTFSNGSDYESSSVDNSTVGGHLSTQVAFGTCGSATVDGKFTHLVIVEFFSGLMPMAVVAQ